MIIDRLQHITNYDRHAGSWKAQNVFPQFDIIDREVGSDLVLEWRNNAAIASIKLQQNMEQRMDNSGRGITEDQRSIYSRSIKTHTKVSG